MLKSELHDKADSSQVVSYMSDRKRQSLPVEKLFSHIPPLTCKVNRTSVVAALLPLLDSKLRRE